MRGFLFASVVVVAASTPLPNKAKLFEDFIVKYDRHYASEVEKGKRFQIFSENVDEIYASNAKNNSYTLGITRHSDQTFEEWRARHLSGFKLALTVEKGGRPVFRAPQAFTEPDSVDWVAKGGVTSVKDQGTCGSCWAFSAVGALEGAMHVGGRSMVNLSVQHILACDTPGSGCSGGQMDQAFAWVRENGVTSFEDEPYLCQDASASECSRMSTLSCPACSNKTGETCFFGDCTHVAGSVCNKDGRSHSCECPSNQCYSDGKCQVREAKPVSLVLAAGDVAHHTDVGTDEMSLEAAVAQQPVSVAIEADKSVFQHYTGGVLTDDACGSNLDHGVLAVGYGVDNGQKYWKVKNSWGTIFGEEGYIRIAKGAAASGGECGIRKMASYPTLKASSVVV